MAPADTPTPRRTKRAKKRKPAWKRKRLWALIILILIPGALMVVVTRTNALSGVVLAGVASTVGGDAEATSVRLTWSGRLVIKDLRLSAPAVDGPAAQIMLAPRVDAGVDWGATLTGSPRVTDLKLIKPLLRLSQHAETGALNLVALQGTQAQPTRLEIPDFTIVDGRIEVGEHTEQWYAPLSSLRVDGSGRQEPNDPDTYTYSFTELNDEGDTTTTSTRVAGSLDLDDASVSAALSAVDLADWSRRTLPSAYQPTWELLDLRGRVPGARLDYTSANGLTFEIALEDVTMRLPVDLREEEGQQLVELTNVDGTIDFAPDGFDADIEGVVEDVPVKLSLDADDFSTDTGARVKLVIDRYRLTPDPPLLPVAPDLAVTILERFGSPTGRVSLNLDLERAGARAPGVPAPWDYRGSVDISDGAAAFEEFPYPIIDITARMTFDDERFSIDRFVGRSRSAGDLSATGFIAPPGDGAEVNIDVAVTDVPLDDTFYDAMPPARRPILDVLFDTSAHERLREEGVFARHAPGFELAGRADLDINVYRPIGMDSRYTTTIDVRIPEAGIVPVGFPYPVVARNVVLRITPDRATVENAALRGLTGMTGAITGAVDMGLDETGEPTFFPDLTIDADTMPIDEVLARALPDAGLAGGSPREALLDLGVEGDVAGKASIMRTPDGRIGFEVIADLQNVASRADAALQLENVSGDLRITRDELDATDLAGTIAGSPFTGNVDVTFADPLDNTLASITGDFRATDIALSAPFEDLARRFEPTAADALDALRARLDPEGRVDATLDFSAVDADPVDYTLVLAPRSDLAIDFAGERWVASEPVGTITATPGVASFDAFSAAIGVEGAERYPALLDGELPFATIDAPARLRVEAEGLALRARTVRPVLEDRFAPALEALTTLGVDDARFDLEADLTFAGDDIDAEWRVTPSAVDLLRRDIRTEFAAEGVITGANADFTIDNLHLTTDTWSATLDGSRAATGAGLFDITADARTIDDTLLSALPAPAADALRAFDVQVETSIALRNASLRLEPNTPPYFVGDILYEGLSAQIGAPITEGIGTGHIEGDENAFTLALTPKALRLARVLVTDASVRAARSAPNTDVVISDIGGELHGGLLTGRGVARTTRDPITYELSTEIVGARFADVLNDLALAEETEGLRRGRLDAAISLYGVAGTAQARRGRATARIQDGVVIDLPGIVPLLELSNLQAPSNEKINLAYLDLFIASDTALIDRLVLFSDSIQIAGLGTVDLPTRAIDLAISTKGARFVPILSPLLEGLREEIASTRVTGTLEDPVFRTEQFRSARALLEAITGRQDDTPLRAGADTRRRAGDE